MEQPGNADLNGMIRDLAGKKYLSLTTFRRNEVAVSTPVEFVERDGTVYIRTHNDSGKVKRIKHNPSVRMAPCTVRGRLLGPPVDAVATLVHDDERESILQLFRNEYGILWRIGTRVRKGKNQYVQLRLAHIPTLHLEGVKAWIQ